MKSNDPGRYSVLPKVVIVGGGFGGLAAARALARAPVEVVLIDRQNHHLFQPLLYQVATAALSPADVAWPIRRLVRRQVNCRVLMARVTGVDATQKHVLLGNDALPYDYLVVASGATHAYFGHDDWAEHAPGLKQIVDATAIRRRLLAAFELAEMTRDPARRDQLLTFVVVGGGPTGVEMAGAIAELARKALAADFRNIDPRKAHVVLVEAGTALLSSFEKDLSDYARLALGKLGVDVRLGERVIACTGNGVQLESGALAAGNTIWAAGVAASPAADWLSTESDDAGRVIVDERLEVPGRDGVFVIGDAAHVEDTDGKLLPGVAPVAKQQGIYAGRLIAARIAGKSGSKPFRYADAGQLATIGRRAAVVQLGKLRFKGRIAWWFWGLVHIYFLINLRSRLIVAIQWFWSYLTFDRGARLITFDD